MTKFIAIVIALIALGAGGAYLYLNSAQPAQPPAAHDDHDGHEHDGLDDTAVGDSGQAGDEHLHGGAAAGANVVLCAKHSIPDNVCAFCHPELKEKLGYCAEHEIAEALCTRCSPILIPAFKIEHDWCEAHGLPESQCKLCGGGAAAPTQTNPAQTNPG